MRRHGQLISGEARVFLVVSVITLAQCAHADGKFYVPPDAVPLDVPYQRALLVFNDECEALFLQSKYQLRNKSVPRDFGWVVPAPTVPELASIEADDAYYIFRDLAGANSRVLHLRFLVAAFLLLACLVAVLLALFCKRFVRFRPGVFGGVLGVLMVIVISSLTYSALGSKSAGVDVLLSTDVGVYSVKVIKSQSSIALIEWLKENGLSYGESDRKVFDDYVGRKWCFVVAKIPATTTKRGDAFGWEGLVAPLILKFPTKEAVYPLALTGTGGRETEVVLYVLSNYKMEGQGRLDVVAASEQSNGILQNRLSVGVRPTDIFKTAWPVKPYLTKLKGRLTPDQMREDLILRHASNDEAQYEWHVRW